MRIYNACIALILFLHYLQFYLSTTSMLYSIKVAMYQAHSGSLYDWVGVKKELKTVPGTKNLALQPPPMFLSCKKILQINFTNFAHLDF